MKKHLTIILIIFFILSYFRINVYAQEVLSKTVYPIEDAAIQKGSSENLGTNPSLVCSKNEINSSYFLVKFDLSTLPSNISIENANITLYQTNASGENINVSVYKVTTNWSEASVSGTNSPSTDKSISYAETLIDSVFSNKTFSQNISDLVMTWINNPSSNFGLLFEASNNTGIFTHEFGSKESGTKPYLSISYTETDITSPIISNIKVSDITETGVTINWDTDENAASFVEYGEDNTYGMVLGDNDLKTSHTIKITSLKSNTVYHFRVKSLDEAGNESVSSDDYFEMLEQKNGEQKEDTEKTKKSDKTIEDSIPIPLNLKAVIGKENGESYVNLTWEKPKDYETDKYRIYRSEEDRTSYLLLKEVEKDETNYTDDTVEEDKTYFYIARTVKGEKESKDSNEEIVTIYGAEINEATDKVNFWKTLIILNVIIFAVLGCVYLIYRKNLKSKKKNIKRKINFKKH